MEKINLNQYGPVIIKKEVGKEILDTILKLNPKENIVEIDMGNIEAMTTFCAKQIFGYLYCFLGESLFSSNIKVINNSMEISLVINMGIQSAIEDSYSSFQSQ